MKVDEVNGDYVNRDKVINVAQDYVENKYENENGYRPPSENDPHRMCPQCGQRAWRYTDIHQVCGFNFSDYEAELLRQEQNKLREALEQRKTIFLLCVFALFLGAIAWGKYVGNSQIVGIIMLACFMFIALLFKKDA
ncbi:MAG: hypothetical protein NVS3B3_01670 [Aquirhabdus sp.]